MMRSESSVIEARHPYAGRRALLATMHRKQETIASPLISTLGWPKATIVRGHIVMRDDEVLGSPKGEMVQFQETLAAG